MHTHTWSLKESEFGSPNDVDEFMRSSDYFDVDPDSGEDTPRPLMTVPPQARVSVRVMGSRDQNPFAAGATLEMHQHHARLSDEPYYQVLCDDGLARHGKGPTAHRLREAIKSFVHYGKNMSDDKSGLTWGVDYVSHNDMLPFTPTREATSR